MIVDLIHKGIEAHEATIEKTTPLRMSSAGKCQRAIAYQLHGFKPEPIKARGLMVFRLGHTIETEMKDLIDNNKPSNWTITYPKEDFFIEVEGEPIIGHVDGILKIDGEASILEIKSTNTRKYKEIENSWDIPYEYKCQATAYMKALSLKNTIFIFYNKDTSHLLEIHYPYDEEIWKVVEKRFSNVIKSTKDTLPDREYGWNSKGKLDWHCSYCQFTKECWPESILGIDRGKPVYKKQENV